MPAADKTLAESAPEPTPTVAFEPAPTLAPEPTLTSALAPTVTGAEYEPPTPVPERTPAASLPPPNGAPPAARAATLLATPTPSIGAPGRARMMTAMQQTVGNARVGAMLQTAPAPAPEGAVAAPSAPAPGAGAAQPVAQGETIAAAPEEAPSGPAEPSARAAAAGGPGAAPAPTDIEEPGPEVAAAASPAPAETTPEAPAEPAGGGPEPAASPPRTPDEDPGFQATVKRVRAVARRQRTHQPAPAAAASAQAAAPGPPRQVPAEAGARQVNRMGEEQKRFKPFDRASFKQRLRDKISLVGPKNPVEAREFSSSPQLASLKNDMTAEVTERKNAAQADLPKKATPPPDASGIEPKAVDPLGPVGIGPAPADPGAGQATPKPLAEHDVSGPMTEEDQQLDDQMAAAQVTEGQLAAANEPSFAAALQAKQEAKAHATQASQTFRQEETSTLAQAQQHAAGSALEQAQAMHAGREQSLTGVRSSQTDTMTADQRARAEIAAHLEDIYKRTSECVRASLTQLDTEVNLAFERGVEAARKAFEDFVEAELDERYSGVLGKATWLEDKLTWGLPFGVELIFRRGRQLYIGRMDALLDEVATIIETKLNAAMLEIVKGEQEIVVFVTSLPSSLQKLGQEAAQAIQGRFDDLEQEVTSKRDQLIDSLAQRYRENVTQLDARIEELKAEHRGLLSKAFDAVVGVIKTILELKNMLLNVLARVGEVVGQIIADPIGFLGNLVSGIRLGLDNFISNIASHLQQAFMSWLFGALQGAGIQLPDQLDLKGVLSIAMQVLGLTYQAIRARAVKLLGEDLVNTLERVAEPFIVLIREGPGGLWEWIKDQLSDLKDKVLGEIQDFLITRVVKAGITWVLSLLNPASAFIRACKLIYDIVMFFVERGRQIIELVNAVIDSVAAIARGSLEGAAKLVENALAKALPVVIGFLASLLNLGGISDKIREIIEKLRGPVTKAVDWVIGKAVSLVKAAGKLLGIGREEAQKAAMPARAGLELEDALPPEVIKARVLAYVESQAQQRQFDTLAEFQSFLQQVAATNAPRGLVSLSAQVVSEQPMVVAVDAAASEPERRTIGWPELFGKADAGKRKLFMSQGRATFAALSVGGRGVGSPVSSAGPEPHDHAEYRLVESAIWLKDLPQAVQQAASQPVTIALAINRAPCPGCAKRLVRAIREAKSDPILRHQQFVLAATGTYEPSTEYTDEERAADEEHYREYAQRLGRPFEEIWEEVALGVTQLDLDRLTRMIDLEALVAAGWDLYQLQTKPKATTFGIILAEAAHKLALKFGRVT
jgi:hypothetical protein